jgi:hypothetical protein
MMTITETEKKDIYPGWDHGHEYGLGHQSQEKLHNPIRDLLYWF